MILKSRAPKDYESLPEMRPPAAYILVMRDIDADTYRIDSAAHPQSAVKEALTERERKFGIELVSVLETEDLALSASELYERHHASLGGDWLELDPYQIEELRRSSLQIDAHASLYVSPGSDAVSGGAAQQRSKSRYERLVGAYLRGSDEAEGFRRAYSRRPRRGRYVADSLRRYRERDAELPLVDSDDPIAWLLRLSSRSEEFFQTTRGKVLKFVLVMLAVAFITLLRNSG